MRLSNGKLSLWAHFFNPFIFTVIFRVVIRVQCTEYRTFDVIPDGTGRIAEVVEVEAIPTPQDQFASRRDWNVGFDVGSLDIRSQYWTRSRRDPDYPDETEREIVGLTEEEAERRPYVQVDRTGKEHTVTINMPRMEGRSRNHLIKKFVLQPVIQYVVQYDKNSQQENGEETQASTNFEEYEGYEGQEKMVKGHERSVDRFFNDIDANFETYWGNDGKGGGYQEGGDTMTGDGGYQSGGSFDEGEDGSSSNGGYDRGYDSQGNQGGSQSQGGYASAGNSQGGFHGMGSGSDQNGYGNGDAGGNLNNNGATQNTGGGLSNNNGGAQMTAGGFNNNGGAQFSGFQMGAGGSGNNQGGNAVAHDFGFTQEGSGGYSSTNQFHQPPDVNAFVSSGGYGVPPQSSPMVSSNNNANSGMQSSGYQGGMSVTQSGGMNLANAAQVTVSPQQQGNSGMGQMFSSMHSANGPMAMNGMGGIGVSGGNGGSMSMGSVGGGTIGHMGSTNPMTGMTSGMHGGMHSPTASLNSLYGVPGMAAGKPLGVEMMMNAMNGGGSSAAAAVASMANAMMGMNQGPMVPGSVPSAIASGTGMMNVPQPQNSPMLPVGSMPQAIGVGAALSSSAVSSMSSGSPGMNLAAPMLLGGGGMGGGAAAAGVGGMPMGMSLTSSGQMGTGGISGTAVTLSGSANGGNSNGISMGFGVPGPMGMISSGIRGGSGMTMTQPSQSYGAPSSSSGGGISGGYPNESYGPPKETTQPSNKPPSSSYGPPKESPGGYGGGSSSEDDAGDDMAPPRGKGKKPGGGGKSKGRGGRGGKSLLSSLPLPKIPQSIGGHLSFMFSTGVGKGRRNRGGGMMGGSSKPGGENTKSVSKDQVSDHISNILGLTVHHPLHNNASLANSTNPILLWEQNGNRTSLNHTSNLQEDTLGDVVDLLPVDAEVLIIPTLTPTDVPQDTKYEVTTTHTPRGLSTTTPNPEPNETELIPKPSNKILIATIPPPTKVSSGLQLPNSILIATIPPLTTTSNPPTTSNNSILIATIEPSTAKPSTLPPPTTTVAVMTTTAIPSTTSSPIPPTSPRPTLVPTSETSTSTLSSNVSTTSPSPTSPPSHTTILPTTLLPPNKIPQRIQTRLRQPKNLALPKVLIATPTPHTNPEIILTPVPTRPHPTPSISIEIDPIQDYINHNLGNNVLTVTNNSPVSYSPTNQPRPNIQAYYAQHDFHRNPVKIEHFDPWIYDALQAAFMPPSHNDLDGRKKKRSRFPMPYRHPFPFHPPVARPRSWFSRLLSKRVDDNGNSSTLAVIPSTSLSLQNKGHHTLGTKLD